MSRPAALRNAASDGVFVSRSRWTTPPWRASAPSPARRCTPAPAPTATSRPRKFGARSITGTAAVPAYAGARFLAVAVPADAREIDTIQLGGGFPVNQFDAFAGALAEEIVCRYVEPDADWQRVSVRRSVPGVAAPDRTAVLDLPGVTSKEQAAKACNLQAASQKYHRRRTRSTTPSRTTAARGSAPGRTAPPAAPKEAPCCCEQPRPGRSS